MPYPCGGMDNVWQAHKATMPSVLLFHLEMKYVEYQVCVWACVCVHVYACVNTHVCDVYLCM